jgi:RNA polymerase sigma-70 factor (ECF subfamily)
MFGDRFEETLHAAQAGAEWAFDELWRELNPPLHRYLRGTGQGAVEDVAAETWMSVARSIGTFSGNERDFHAWFFTIARRRLVDQRRRAVRLGALETHDDGEAADVVDPESDPADRAVEQQRTNEALRLISQLPPDQADVILLRVVGGLDTNQVADLLAKRPGAIRALQHRALRRLAARIGQPRRELDREGVESGQRA